ncbi:hypothetical protein [Roseimaritima sediminicola]|uniref:hypothetical protein n=1 Tax=Roseimaritima sediminicola TaxID=2662066 RepID=UPI001F2EE1AE|nr:hypothetical protein [Roseimaritima sediminicola]
MAATLRCTVLFCALLVAAGGCSITRDSLADGRVAFLQGDLQASRELLQAAAEKDRRWGPPARLDLAIAHLAAGDNAAAERLLRESRDHFDRLPGLDPLDEAGSMLTDDTKRTYRAADYEQVMMRAMLALCSLASDGTDAEAYAMQAQLRQAELAQAATERAAKRDMEVGQAYQPIALAPYLRGVLRESTHQDYDDAARAYQLVAQWQPTFAPAGSDIQRASGGVHSPPGHGVLYVFACVGRGPVRVEKIAETTSDALRIAALAVDHASGQAAIPRVSNVPIAEVFIPPSPAFGLGVRVDQHALAATTTLTDVGLLAQRQADAERPWTIARAVLRRVAKEAAVKAAGNALGMDGQMAGIFSFAAGSFWQASEKADLRCWGLLPREIQVVRIELPAGRHRVGLEVLGSRADPIGPVRHCEVDILDGENSYLLAFAPAERVVAIQGNRTHNVPH